jgi:hypothetical protein
LETPEPGPGGVESYVFENAILAIV